MIQDKHHLLHHLPFQLLLLLMNLVALKKLLPEFPSSLSFSSLYCLVVK